MKIRDCRVNHIENPLGYRLNHVDFSWRADGMPEEHVEAWRITVQQENEEAIDTGWTDLDPLGTPAEMELRPRTCYRWRVAARLTDGTVAESEENRFETGKMNEPWQGKWITAINREEPRHPVFRRRFALRKKVIRARLYICGLGLYEARINGRAVADEHLTPYCNSYDRWLQVQTFDVTDLLEKENEIAVMLGNGWYRGRFGFDQKETPAYGAVWKLIAEMHVTLEDGSECCIATDDSWTVTRSDITFSSIYDGEHADETLADLPEEETILVSETAAPLTDRMSLPVRIHEEFQAELLHTPNGEAVFDTGQNMAGIFRFHVREPKGTRIRLQFGEVLQDGCFYRDNLRTAKAEYVLVTDGTDHWVSPHFTFYGYRYVKVEGCKDLREGDFVAEALYSSMRMNSSLSTGHEGVNRLIRCAEWGMRSNFLDVPTDCPQRDERMGWTGDAQVFSRTAMYLADPYAFYAKYLYDMAEEQKACGGLVPYTVPSFHIHQAAAAWSDATVLIPWNLYEFYGDATILSDHYDAMKAWVDYMERQEKDEHGWTRQFHFGDWLALDGEKTPEAVRGLTDEAFIAAVYFRMSAFITAEAAGILGFREDQKHYEELAEEIRSDIMQEWYTPSGRCAITSMTAQILSLKECLGSPYTARDTLAKLLRFNNGRLATGFVGTPLICPVLTEYGMQKQAYDLLLNEEYPGWLHEIRLGATTVWERWNSLDEEGHISGTGMNSLNHYAYGSVVEWIYAYAAGIRMLKPGFRRAVIEPVTDSRLGFADCRYESASGTYEVHWKIIDRWHMHMEWKIPYGCGAEVHLPLCGRIEGPLASSFHRGIGYFTQGSYSVDYETDEPTDQVITLRSSVREALAVPKVKEYLEKIPLFAQSEFSFMNSTVAEALSSCALSSEKQKEAEKQIISLQ